jgi:hypothetical protein
MANLTIQGENIEMKTDGHNIKRYYAEVSFNTSETVESDYCKTANISMGSGSRSDFTFDRVETEINQYFEDNHPDLEIVEFLGIEVYEKETIKRRPFDNYEY